MTTIGEELFIVFFINNVLFYIVPLFVMSFPPGVWVGFLNLRSEFVSQKHKLKSLGYAVGFKLNDVSYPSPPHKYRRPPTRI